MTERPAAWRWASESVRRRFNARARAMGTFQPFPLETRRRYREHLLSAIDEIARFPEAATMTSVKDFRAKTIASPGTAQGEVIVYTYDGGAIIVFGVFAYLPAGFFAG